MRYRGWLAAAAVAALAPNPLLAQPRPAPTPAARPLLPQYAGPHREGSWELTVSAGALLADQQFVTGRIAPGGALRISYHVNETWDVSAGTGLGFASANSEVPGAVAQTLVQPFAAVTWTPDINRVTSPFLTAGAGGTYDAFSGGHLTAQYGAHLGIGLRHMIGETVALRIEVREQYEHFKEFSNSVYNGIGTVGLSFFVGGGPLKDSDGDGVPDKYDRCPDTPRGAVVDARGCPTDSDHDGVPDGLDRCANTPAGVRVDVVGCPIDGDHDGVPDYLDKCPDTPAGVQVYQSGSQAGCPVDSDGDGVPDYQDRCPNTPKGAPVDANGCPKDTDGDGVPDYLDRCPDTPRGAVVDASGCPVDSDHDGVPDYLDRCPNTAPGTPVDANGCPVEKDSDGDGVPDSRDTCPDTPHGVRVDADGCPFAPLPAVNERLVLANVGFRTNRAEMSPAATAALDRIAIAVLATRTGKWEIGAFTDGVGPAARNVRLSQQRADAVKAYLVSRGVPAASFLAVGYGGQQPLVVGRTRAARQQNERIEIKRLQ